ncbi:uncharacterized protein ASCRUDRAFT_71147 [Ascoidea rubescens DSM 1968]|uniref:Extracellular membrane protein CFEM domain-containing protein n=1 Tax=Ascoidea rubescens DSM 1968 TaxID=1344418 RepID=A0A1D2VEU6_9ASCO|nr:hypothetical protein ASCRUDRAFT_71147 [Ascoidea rubescens DSM 1968]ODV60102.1 hypothetical protein ASCRUDRAFT_71147 [Ascoidea rubescens DSM 1968]
MKYSVSLFSSVLLLSSLASASKDSCSEVKSSQLENCGGVQDDYECVCQLPNNVYWNYFFDCVQNGGASVTEEYLVDLKFSLCGDTSDIEDKVFSSEEVSSSASEDDTDSYGTLTLSDDEVYESATVSHKHSVSTGAPSNGSYTASHSHSNNGTYVKPTVGVISANLAAGQKVAISSSLLGLLALLVI